MVGSAEGSALLRGLEVEDLGFYFVFRKASESCIARVRGLALQL